MINRPSGLLSRVIIKSLFGSLVLWSCDGRTLPLLTLPAFYDVAKAKFISGFLLPDRIKSNPAQNVKSGSAVSETCTPPITPFCHQHMCLFASPGWLMRLSHNRIACLLICNNCEMFSYVGAFSRKKKLWNLVVKKHKKKTMKCC